MQKTAEIDYQSYAKAMRGVLSGPQICLPDNSLNHEYFNAKKGFYWSEQSELKLVDGLKKYGKDWRKISSQYFNDSKTEVQLQMRACILLKVKDGSQINEKQFAGLEKKVRIANGIASQNLKNGATKPNKK